MECTYEGRTLPAASISIGIAQWPEDGAKTEELIGAADRALYLAKHGGRDQVSIAGSGLPDAAPPAPDPAGDQITGKQAAVK